MSTSWMGVKARKAVATGVATAAIAAAAVNLGGCGGENVAPLLAAIDHTGSSAQGSTALCARQLTELVRDRYLSVNGQRGEIRVDVFDVSTAAGPTFPARGRFEVPADKLSNPGDTTDDLAGDLRAFEQELNALVEDAGPPFGGTDVVTMLAAMGDAARAAGARQIWLCSDIVDSRLEQPITRAGVDAVLARLRERDALPDLSGIAIVIDTISVRGRADLSAAELSALRMFAERLVHAAGGELAGYGPGATGEDHGDL